MAIASVTALIAVLPPSLSLFLRRPSALAARPVFFPPRNSLAHRFPGLVFPARLPSIPRLKSCLAVAAAGDADAIDIDWEHFDGERTSDSLDNSAANGDGESGLGEGNSEEKEEGEPDEEKKVDVGRMSISQKLTLGYAALVGVYEIMYYFVSGNQKSLAAGGVGASLLYYVCTLLPVRPAFASSVGLGLSSAFLCVMGSRFISSGRKVLPGIISLVSLVMSAVYFHGIIHSSHT